MKAFKRQYGSYPLGVWISIVALILIFLAWIMQSYSLLDWEGAVSIGLQEYLFTGNEAESALADVERGIAIADIIWALPLTILAFIGILKRSVLGFATALMTFSICVYFPLIYLFRDNFTVEIKVLAMILWAIPSLLGIIGLWVNRKLFIY